MSEKFTLSARAIPCRLLFCLALIASLSSCRKNDESTFVLQTDLEQPLQWGAPSSESVDSYRVDARAFAPTLDRLFANGRLLVIPQFAAGGGIDAANDDYAFSAVDGLGNLYHFTRTWHWNCAPLEPRATELPLSGWAAAWNSSSRRMELLRAQPSSASEPVELSVLTDGQWVVIETEDAPQAAEGALVAHEPTSGSWFVILPAGDQPGFYRLDKNRWDKLPVHPELGIADAAQVIIYPPLAGLALLTRQGDLWLWAQGSWTHEAKFPEQDYLIFHYNSARNRIMLGNSRGIGQTTLREINLIRGATQRPPEARSSTASDLVLINDEIQGLWGGPGKLSASAGQSGTAQSFSTDLSTSGTLVLSIETRQGGSYWKPEDIEIIEFPPQFINLKQGAGVFVPALAGYVEVSNKPSTDFTLANVPFPYADALTTPTLAAENPPSAALRAEQSRFWLFDADGIEWIKGFPEAHPDYEHDFQLSDPRSDLHEFLSWGRADETQFSYRYKRYTEDKVEWVDSPLLTLRDLPEAGWNEGDSIHLLPPVTRGKKREVAIAGWSGILRQAPASEEQNNSENRQLYSSVPDHGFLAHIDALLPEEWISTTLPISFARSAALVSAPERGDIYLLGGEVAVESDDSFYFKPNTEVWRYNENGWTLLPAAGNPPKLQFPFAAAFDPLRDQLLVLNHQGLLGFKNGVWIRYGELSADRERPLDTAPGLYLHPSTGQVLALWHDPSPVLAAWEGDHWAMVEEVQVTQGQDPRPLLRAENIFPMPYTPDYLLVDKQQMHLPRERANTGPMSAPDFGFRISLVPVQ